MRLPHHADGGRDTEKKWYRGMVDVTVIKDSNRMALGLGVEQNAYHS